MKKPSGDRFHTNADNPGLDAGPDSKGGLSCSWSQSLTFMPPELQVPFWLSFFMRQDYTTSKDVNNAFQI